MNRRHFLVQSGAAAAAWSAGAQLAAAQEQRTRGSANERITIAAIGVRGRGGHVLGVFASRPDVDVKYVCDVDQNVLEMRSKGIADSTGRRPQMIKDFRHALDDSDVDAILLGTPEHWHAIPTILACQAGKDVYVEKPDGHNIVESERMVAAQRKHQRVVQLGTQARSAEHTAKLTEYLAAGSIGRPLFAKAWESARQGSIGRPPDGEPPTGVDYDLWLGPAPKRPFNPVRFHGNWRWFFDYGTGDLGNDGVHRLDLARWAFETALGAAGDDPLGRLQAVTAHGAKCYFDDLQEWPDNLMITYDWGRGRLLTYEMRLWTPYPMFGETEGAAVYGDQGYVVIGNSGWRAFGPRDESVHEERARGDIDAAHVENFLACMRSRKKPNADLETVGHLSSMLCHLGNAAWRTGRCVHFDWDTYRFDEEEANRYLTRAEYRQPWHLPDV